MGVRGRWSQSTAPRLGGQFRPDLSSPSPIQQESDGTQSEREKQGETQAGIPIGRG